MSTAALAVGRLQTALEAVHDVDSGLVASDYLIDADFRNQLPGAQQGSPEQLFVLEAHDTIDLALYLDARVLEVLKRDPPERRLHTGNFEAFCIALEGVSHFVLLTWRVRRDWPVSALELEVQAEVDKFIISWFLLAEQGVCAFRGAEILRRHLFHRWSLRDGLSKLQARRYRDASRLAERFCMSLSRLPELTDARDDARVFFRLGLSEKLRHRTV